MSVRRSVGEVLLAKVNAGSAAAAAADAVPVMATPQAFVNGVVHGAKATAVLIAAAAGGAAVGKNVR